MQYYKCISAGSRQNAPFEIEQPEREVIVSQDFWQDFTRGFFSCRPMDISAEVCGELRSGH